jgi:hypothetical protein
MSGAKDGDRNGISGANHKVRDVTEGLKARRQCLDVRLAEFLFYIRIDIDEEESRTAFGLVLYRFYCWRGRRQSASRQNKARKAHKCYMHRNRWPSAAWAMHDIIADKRPQTPRYVPCPKPAVPPIPFPQARRECHMPECSVSGSHHLAQ